MAGYDLNNNQEYGGSPSLRIDPTIGGRSGRYPNVFFDLAQQYMPPTMVELLRWCTFYFYNSPLVGSAITKMSRYPITDLIIEDEHESVRELWDNIFNIDLKIKATLLEINLDYHVYGNSFVSVFLPFTRFLICKQCGGREDIRQASWSFNTSAYEFHLKCKKCGSSGTANVKDTPYRDRKGFKIIRWNPENIRIKCNEYTGRKVYMYILPYKLKNAIMRGDKDIIEDMPMIVLEAMKNRRMIRFNNSNFFHLKRPTLAEQDQGWGKPLIVHVLKDMYYLYTLRRAQEAIAMEHIVPFDLIYPMPNAQQDPYIHTDLAGWRSQIEMQIMKHRRDPNYKAVIPVPVGFGRLGGDGKAMLLTPELNLLAQQIVGGMGIPLDFIMGGLNWCIAPHHKIYTSQGLLKLEEFCPTEVGFEAPADSMLVATKDTKESIVLVHRTEKKKPYTIKTKLGLSITGSKIHRVWTLNEDLSMGWKHLEDVKTGDYVAVSRGDDIWGNKTPSKELCRMLGYLVAEGSLTEKVIEFSNTNEALLIDYCNCFKTVFGSKPSYWDRPYTEEDNHFGLKTIFQTQSKSKEVINFFRELGMLGYSDKKAIPRLIRESTKECVFEFMKALFEGDGCNSVSNDKQCVTYNSISPELLEDIQLVLLNAGIVSSVYDEYICKDGITKTCPTLQIRSEDAAKFLSEIGFITKGDKDNSVCNPQGFRCEHNKVPFLKDRLIALKKITHGRGAWIKDNNDLTLNQSVYSTREAACVLDRDHTSVLNYIKKGKLVATREERKDGRFCTYLIKREDLQTFLDIHGTSKRISIGETYWEVNGHNENKINWESVQELDPQLYERYQEVKNSRFIWDMVEEKSESNSEIEMCDLTVSNTHSYVAGGLVSHNTGSSVSLRTLENDFIQNRTQLLDVVNWIKDKLRFWLNLPNVKKIRFSDFRMADDIQRNQQLIGLNAAQKVSDQTLLTELGYNYDQEVKKMIEEVYVQNYLNDLRSKGMAKAQGESLLIQQQFQDKIQKMISDGQEAARARITNQQNSPGMEISPENLDPNKAPPPGIENQVERWASRLAQLPPQDAQEALMELKQKFPDIGNAVEQAYHSKAMADQGQGQPTSPTTPGAPQGGAAEAPPAQMPGGPEMQPMPEKMAPRRQGAV